MANQDLQCLFLAHRTELLVYLTRKLRDAEVAADLTQETFLRFTEHVQSKEPVLITNQRSYLYRMAHNLAIDHVRQRTREPLAPVSDEQWFEIPDEQPTPERVTSGQTDLAFVHKCLLTLPERTRQIFVMTRLEGLTYSEVAKRLGISDSSVQKHLARAIKCVMDGLRAGQA